MEKFASRVGIYAYVGYACPAFHERVKLFSYQASSSLVGKSSFVRVERLKSHDHWAYHQPGTIGQALSEPEYVEAVSFSNELEYLTRADFLQKIENNFDVNILFNLSTLTEMIVESCEESSKSCHSSWFLDEYRRMRRETNNREQEQEEVLYYFSCIQLFCNIIIYPGLL